MDFLVWGLLAFSTMLLLGGATIIYFSSEKSLQRTIAWLLYACAFWTVTSGVQSAFVSESINLLLVRLTFVAGLIMSFAIFLAVIRLIGKPRPVTERVVLGATIVGVLLSLSPFVIEAVTSQNNSTVPVRAFLYPFVVSILGMQLLASIVTMARGVAELPRGNTKSQYRVVLWGVTIGTMIGVCTNIVLPLLAPNLHSSRFAWLATLTWATVLFVAVIRHRFLDIRFALVRSAGYTLSLITLTGAYYLLLVVGSQLLGYVRRDMSLPETAVNIVVIIMLSTAFQPIKQFFDRITDRIFYRDRYDTNEFITRLGKILTSTTKLHEVLEKSGSEISATLKSSGYEFFVYRDNHPDVQVGTLIKKHFDDEASHTLHQLVTLHHERVIVVSDIEHEHEVAIRQLRSAIERRHISLVVPLMSNEELIGCLLLGEQQGGGYTKRDIRALETVVDSLVIAIQNARSVQVVRDLNTHLEQRVNSATKELRATNRQLIELDTTKDEFVSMASHQLRTPLTSIKGYLSMVLEGDVGKITAEQRQLLDEAFTSSERMVHLISDFLNVSRLQTGKFMIDRKKTDLANVVSQEVESMKQIAESHGMTIRYRQPSVFPVLYIDDDKLRQVIMNFIDNAIYYSPDSRAPIIVKLAVEDGYAVFRVVDKGMGVPVEVQRQLFTKFFRAENARKQRPDGTGIGLYLAKRVIDGHGGKLVFESAEGKGSTFGFRLPVRKLSQPPVERTNDDSEIK